MGVECVGKRELVKTTVDSQLKASCTSEIVSPFLGEGPFASVRIT